MFAVGALDAYFCDAYSDLVAATVISKSRRPSINLPEWVLEIEVRGGPLLQELAQFHKRALLGKLRPALPAMTLTDLKFRAGA